MRFEWVVQEKQAGCKLVQFLQQSLREKKYSLRKLKSYIDRGWCTVNQKIERFASIAVKKNDRICLLLPDEQESSDIGFSEDRIVYEDEYFFAYDKPAGVSCDEQGIVAQCKKIKKPCILVHRLDKGTSGVLLIAKMRKIADYFIEQFKERAIRKEYLAIVHGIMKDKQGTIENHLGPLKSAFGQQKWGKVAKNGFFAHTDFACVTFGEHETLVRLFPRTGRTHQLRIHMADKGHPILGDPLYGKGTRSTYEAYRLMLHAEKVTFIHPITKEVMHISAPVSDEMKKAIVQLFKSAL
jgi:23S rRNA pseudouridine955/2504/2580 synthase/23S rRNA pseudouridine1911/1915/1917 synthase